MVHNFCIMMAIMRWDPFHEFDRMFGENWGLVPMMKSMHIRIPAADVSETDKEVIVEIEVPAGIDPEKVDIMIESDMLTARGSVEEEHETKDKHYHRKEIRKGSFERHISLPVRVKADAAVAVSDKGILKIVIPKLESEKASKVHVQVQK